MKTLCRVGALAVGIALTTVRMPNATAMSMDCGEGKAMMLKAHSAAQGTPTMSGDVDKDFAAMEIQASKAQVMMANIEMTCGKTAAEKASAAKLLQESQERLQLLLQQGLRPEQRP